ncbi:hypothetical protein GILI108418_11685 [Gillisia limnaea]|uniref:Uncharacterized protein n=1 Tax=Gillisia limnaea (strain DSM 15749 / LMG 21470 / R-8282) TaxID=865937 RepID=H2BYD9_GILLR|nr:hypothetical protein Gilli_2662 [Gillisia limnaea DSM 15749]
MIFKLIIKIGILAIELFLAFYSLLITDSLLVKFLFFAFTAIIIAFLVTKITDKLLPSDKDHVSDMDFIQEMESKDTSIK